MKGKVGDGKGVGPLIRMDICACGEEEAFIFIIVNKLMWNTYCYLHPQITQIRENTTRSDRSPPGDLLNNSPTHRHPRNILKLWHSIPTNPIHLLFSPFLPLRMQTHTQTKTHHCSSRSP